MRTLLGLVVACGLLFVAGTMAPAEPPDGSTPTADSPAKKPRLDQYGDPLPEGAFYRLGPTRLRHQGVRTLIFSADGKQLLSQGSRWDLRLWEVQTGRLVRNSPQLINYHGLTASPDDHYLAAAVDTTEQFRHGVTGSISAKRDEIHLLDKATGETLAKWKHENGWMSLAFSRDGKTLVGLTHDLMVYRWDVASRKEMSPLALSDFPQLATDSNYHFGLSPDGAVVAGHMGEVGTWHFWDAVTGKPCRSPIQTPLVSRTDRGFKWSISPKVRLIAQAKGRGSIQIWDIVRGQSLDSFTAQKLAFHPNDQQVALSDGDHVTVVNLGNAKSETWRKSIPPGNDSIRELAFSPDGKTLAIASDATITLLDAATGERMGFSRFDPGPVSAVSYYATTPFVLGGRAFCAVCPSGISLRDTTTSSVIRAYDKGEIRAVSPSGTVAALVMPDNHEKLELRFVELVTGKELWCRPDDLGYISFANDSKSLASVGGGYGPMKVIDAATGREIKSYPGDNDGFRRGNVSHLPTWSLSTDLQMLARRDINKCTIETWDMSTGKVVAAWEGPSDWSGCRLHVLTKGSRVVGSGEDHPFFTSSGRREPPITYIWDAASGKQLHYFEGDLLALSSNEQWLALAKDDTIVIRNAHTGRVQSTMPRARCFGFSPDESLLVTVSEDGHAIGIWETISGRQVQQWRDNALEFCHLGFTPDCRSFVLSSKEGAVLMCDITGLATAPGKLPAFTHKPAALDRLWADLASDDGPRSHRALWSLVAGGDQSVQDLQKRLRAVKQLDAKEAAMLLTDLDHDRSAVRQKAMHALERQETAWPALVETLNTRPTLEMRLRVEQIQAKLTDMPWDAELQRQARAVTVLEQIGTPPARQLLEGLAAGVPQARLTKIARAALDRVPKGEK